MPAYRSDPRLPGAIPDRTLVRLRPHGLRDAGCPAPHAGLGCLFAPELGIGQDPDRRVRLLLDLGFTRGITAEAAVRESARSLHELEELRLRGAANRVLLAPLCSGGEQARLDLIERC